MSLSASDSQYLRDKKVPDLLEALLQQLLKAKPDSPAEFLRNALGQMGGARVTPKILISGPPAGGKGTQCEEIVNRFGVVHISTGDLLRAEVQQGTPAGRTADECMRSGQLVPDDVIIAMVQSRLAQPDVQERGWLLDGFPRTKEQAAALHAAGVVPQVMVLLEVPDEVVTERVEGRRNDPVTGKVYHMVFNPPPQDAEVLGRLVQRKDDTREAMVQRLQMYHKNVGDVIGSYTNVVVRVDGNRAKDLVAADTVQSVAQRVAAAGVVVA
jgi:adenylate kinase